MTVNTNRSTWDMESCPGTQWVQDPRKQDGGSKEGRLASKINRVKVWNTEEKFWHPLHIAPVLTKVVWQRRLCDSSPRFSFAFSSWRVSGDTTNQFQKTTDKLDSPNFSVPSNLNFLRTQERDTILKVKFKCEDMLQDRAVLKPSK